MLGSAVAVAAVGFFATRRDAPKATPPSADAHAASDASARPSDVPSGTSNPGRQAKRTWLRSIPRDGPGSLASAVSDDVETDDAAPSLRLHFADAGLLRLDETRTATNIPRENTSTLCRWFDAVREPELGTYRLTTEEEAMKDAGSACTAQADADATKVAGYMTCIETKFGAWALELRDIEQSYMAVLDGVGHFNGWSAELWAVKLESADAGSRPAQTSVRVEIWPDPYSRNSKRVGSGDGVNTMAVDALSLFDVYGDDDLVQLVGRRHGDSCTQDDRPEPSEALSMHLGMKNGKPRWVPPPKPKR